MIRNISQTVTGAKSTRNYISYDLKNQEQLLSVRADGHILK